MWNKRLVFQFQLRHCGKDSLFSVNAAPDIFGIPGIATIISVVVTLRSLQKKIQVPSLICLRC
jgi:hypothetical protein